MNYENLQDIINIKEVMGNALNHLYEGRSYRNEVLAFGQDVYIYTEDGRYGTEVIITSSNSDFAYVLDNSNSTQADILKDLMK